MLHGDADRGAALERGNWPAGRKPVRICGGHGGGPGERPGALTGGPRPAEAVRPVGPGGGPLHPLELGAPLRGGHHPGGAGAPVPAAPAEAITLPDEWVSPPLLRLSRRKEKHQPERLVFLMHTITIWTFLNSLQADRTAPGLLAGGAGTPYKPFSLKAKTLAQEWLYHSEHFNPGGWSRELRFRYFKFTINCLETCPTVLLDRGAFAAFERFAKGKTSAQGEFTSPEQFKGPQVSKKEAPALQVLLFWNIATL